MRLIFAFIFILTVFSAVVFAQIGSLGGQVVDQNGALIPGANVTMIGSNGFQKTVITNRNGEFNFTNLPVGSYTLRVVTKNFAQYENKAVTISNGKRMQLQIPLTVTIGQQDVTVSKGNEISTEPDNNKSAIVLRGEDLKTLPEDPDELAAALQALAGPAVGPEGGQFFIDGFTSGRLPPRESIREIRVNDNPFSAEIDRVSFGRVEIFTKPGADKLQGQFFFNFNDESLNARNPFASQRAATQTRFWGGNLSGSLIKNKMSFFLDFDRRSIEENATVNATIIDQSLNPFLSSESFIVPARRFSISPRLDYAINEKNTFFGRYSFTGNEANNRGIGDFSLPTRAFSQENSEHTLQLVETSVLASNIINESRFQYIQSRNQQDSGINAPTINVVGSFIGGGSNIGQGLTSENRSEFQNYTTWILDTHSLKFGGRLRGVVIKDRSETNFAGIFTFAGRNGIDSLEQYRQRLLNNPNSLFNPNQFTITSGEPFAKISQIDFGGFINDDWRVRQNLTLSFGLRYEAQSNIGNNLNFAPRISFAWAPGNDKQPKTVFRGGLGIFYERIAENLSLQEFRFNGQRQSQFIVSDVPEILGQPIFSLNSVTNVPTIAQIAALVPNSNTIRQLVEDIESPFMTQGAISLERQFPFRTTLTFTYLAVRITHLLRTRNINAPICLIQNTCPIGQPLSRPFPAQGNIYQFESGGKFEQHQFMINFRTRFHPKITIFGNYRLGSIKSDTDGVNTFPANSYDLSNEYSASLSDGRHFLLIGSFLNLPWNFRIGSYITATSGRPFNITKGIDNNQDSFFTERPTFTELDNACLQLGLNKFFCDIRGIANPDTTIIPRNYGRGPAAFNINLNIGKTFDFGGGKSQTAQPSNQPPDKPYHLTFGLQIFNLLNCTNAGQPIGNLSSPRFGKSNFLATYGFFNAGGSGGGLNSGNRRVTVQIRFSF